MSRYWTGERLPQGELLFEIADDVGETARFLVTGERGPGDAPATIASDPDEVEIDNVDLSYGLGGTFLDVGDPEAEKVKFSRKWLRRFTHSPPEMLGSTEGVGDSMEPVIYDRDIVIFDRSARLEDHLSDKMWVFAFGQIGMIKRLRPMPDGTVKIMSANRTYPDEVATGEELHIIGRVVATVRRH